MKLEKLIREEKQKMSMSVKRNLQSTTHSDAMATKRRCLGNGMKIAGSRCINIGSPENKLCTYRSKSRKGKKNGVKDYDASFSSSSSDDDDDENNSNTFLSSRLRSKSRSNQLRKVKSLTFAIDSKLSKAVSQYSDDSDNDENEEVGLIRRDSDSCTSFSSERSSNNKKLPMSNILNNNMNIINNCSNSFSNNKKFSSTNNILNVNYVSNHGLLNNKRYSVNINDVVNSIPSSIANNNANLDNSFTSFNVTNRSLKHNNGSIPRCDLVARFRCFEYLVGAIDEAWARYCNSTSYDEDLAYDYDNDNDRDCSNISCNNYAPIVNTPNSQAYSSDDDGYKTEFSATTTVTEYDSDFHNNNKIGSFSMMSNPSGTSRRVSEVPENVRLQELKDRFTRYKYYLEDMVDSDLYNDCLAFWTKWDLIKYSIVDFVEEEDDEDEDIERRIDELESGRFSGSYIN